uniref:ISXO2-like transposase domain-containing protein n=1 Tax=Aliivibrio wodanis TaxID=80852 RepID=A0A5Q4ZWU4_9GAMM|nr:hypothetical protein AW0309160_03422 [Aliivibrio wodanis]
MISNVKNSMHRTYHAINNKHLPRYLGEFVFKFNRRFNLEKILDQLIYSSIQTAPMPERLLKLAESRGNQVSIQSRHYLLSLNHKPSLANPL